jgi:hypothetical protein
VEFASKALQWLGSTRLVLPCFSNPSRRDSTSSTRFVTRGPSDKAIRQGHQRRPSVVHPRRNRARVAFIMSRRTPGRDLRIVRFGLQVQCNSQTAQLDMVHLDSSESTVAPGNNYAQGEIAIWPVQFGRGQLRGKHFRSREPRWLHAAIRAGAEPKRQRG